MRALFSLIVEPVLMTAFGPNLPSDFEIQLRLYPKAELTRKLGQVEMCHFRTYAVSD